MYWIGDFLFDGIRPYTGEAVSTTSSRGKWVDEDKFEIKPRKSYLEKQLKYKDDELETVERQRKMMNEYYDNRRKQIQTEKEQILNQIKDAG
jgi:hypothetical protein